MRHFIFFLLVLALIAPAFAESGSMNVVGSSTDQFGTKASVTVVELGRDKYLAINLESPNEPQGATAIILKNEVAKLLKMGDRGAKEKSPLKTGEFKIIDSFPGESGSFAVIRANADGNGTHTIIQINEEGRERNFLLTPQSWAALKSNIKKASKKL